MKKTIQIKSEIKKCNIIIQNDCLEKYIKSELNSKKKIFIIFDHNILYKIDRLIKNKNNVYIYKIKGSEKIKSIKFYWKIISFLLDNKIDRSSTLISIGGGTIGDISGFIASTILRGLRFVLIPSTLLSQVDSSVGGKNGINTKHGKNLIGTFSQPDLVIIDPLILKSLSLKQLKSGYAEIIKHALINDINFFRWLKNNYKKILLKNKKALIYAITKSINIKLKFVMKDEKEKLTNQYSRAVLNFGHTFGHALETMNSYKSNFTHGEAIAIGMVTASKISHKLNYLKKEDLDEIIAHFKDSGLPCYSKKIKNNKIYKLILADKKNINDKINLILLKKIGKPYYKRGLNISKVKNLIN